MELDRTVLNKSTSANSQIKKGKKYQIKSDSPILLLLLQYIHHHYYYPFYLPSLTLFSSKTLKTREANFEGSPWGKNWDGTISGKGVRRFSRILYQGTYCIVLYCIVLYCSTDPLDLRIQDWWSRIKGSGIKDPGSRVQDKAYGLQDSSLRIQDLKLARLDSGSKIGVHDVHCRIGHPENGTQRPGTKIWAQGSRTRYWGSGDEDRGTVSKSYIQNCKAKTHDPRLRIPDWAILNTDKLGKN